MTTKQTPATHRAGKSGWMLTRQSDPNSFRRRSGKRLAALAWLLSGTTGLFSPPGRAQTPFSPEATATPMVERLRPSAPVFVENRGQWTDASVRFVVNCGGVNVGLTDAGLRCQLIRREPSPEVREFSVRFAGARRVAPEGETKARPVFHFQQGAPEGWREDVPSWQTVLYRSLYEGIDLRLRCEDGTIRYEFVVAPGADWKQARVQYHGVERVDSAGDGISEVIPGEGWPALLARAPVIRQEVGGQRTDVAERFASVEEQAAAPTLAGASGPAPVLVVEGALEWSAALGGTADDAGNGIATDGLGNILLVGTTSSSGWISGSFAWTRGGGTDAFVAKLSPDGDLIWSRYLGGAETDAGRSIATDSANNVVVTGTTSSGGWVQGGYETVKFYDNPAEQDPFVVKLNPNGNHLWSTYLGKGDFQTGAGIAVDPADNILVTGSTYYLGWILTIFSDGFVAKLSPTGTKLWATQFGDLSALADGCTAIAADSQGNVLVTGNTASSFWVYGGQDVTYNGGTDAFVAKFTRDGKRLWSTYLGGAGEDTGSAIAVDDADNMLVAGGTYSGGWVKGGFDTLRNGGKDGFVAKLRWDGAIVWSTFLGGVNADGVRGIACDGAGNVYAVGSTYSPGWIRGGYDTTYHGAGDAFVFALGPTGTNLWSTYLGGGAEDYCNGVAQDAAGNVLIVGKSFSRGWTSEPFKTNLLRGGNAFVARLRAASGDAGCSLATPEPRVPRRGNVGTTTPLLWWADVKDESGYVINVYSGTSLTGALVHTSLVLPPDTTSYPLPDSAGLEQKTTYSWQVKALGDGVMTCDSSWSLLFPFTVATNLAPDKTRPTMQFTSPQPHSRVYSPVITARGKASDNRTLAEVRYRVNDGGWAQANGRTSWNGDVSLQPGSNMVYAFSVDGSGLVSKTNRLPLFFVVQSPLILVTNGEGSISRQFKGMTLEIGRTYKVTAVPESGHVFSHWSGSIAWPNPTDPVLNFIMESNLVIEANFVPNPFATLKGGYQGLFFAGAGADHAGDMAASAAPIKAASSGSVTLTLTRRGAASGVVVLAGRRHSFSGMRIDATGFGHAQLRRGTPGSPLALDVRFDLANGVGMLTGRISGDGWDSGLLAFRTGPRSTHAGRYTFVLSGGAADDTTAPTGHGTGVITVATNGSVRLAGRLADGTPVSLGSRHSDHGWWPIYLPLQAGSGVMLGWAQFIAETDGCDLLGTCLWLKAPAVTTEQHYPQGFAVMQELWGSRY